MIISLENAHKALETSPTEFSELFTHGTLSVEIYKPNKVDK